MALAKILQMLLRSQGGKKAAAKLYKQASKGKGYRERPGLTSDNIPDMSMKDYRKFYGKDPRLDKSYMRATRKMEKDDRMAQLWDKRPDVIASRDAAQLADWKKYGSPSRASLPTKSPGTPGVKVGSKPSWDDVDYFERTGTYQVPEYYKKFPKKMVKEMWQDRDLHGLKYPGGYPGMNDMKDFIRKGYSSGRPWNQMARKLPSNKPQMVRGELVQRSSIGGPTETTARRGEILERIMKMRKDPGMARGLQRMESRKASAMNTPGTPFEGRALRYEPSIARAANFNSLIVKDKGFREFLANTVGNKKVMDISPSMKDKLAKRYLSLKRKNIDAAEAYSREMDIMEGPDVRYWRMIRGLGDLD